MNQDILNEINYHLDKMVADRLSYDRYANEELVRRHLTEEFAKWLVDKFKEETGYD